MLKKFSVITPSFRSSDWLKLCIASVADQGVEVEHIVQDAGSDDGTLDWLTTDARVKACVEPDKGMYDAINRGLRKASGEILSYLNCDEQYLPGALSAVGTYFEQNPDVDMLFADSIIVDGDGKYICHRKVLPPRALHTRVCHLSTLTCATFFRRRILDQGLYFDDAWRIVGDAEWILRALDKRVRMGILRQFTSVFVDTGANMGTSASGVRESELLRKAAPAWARKAVAALVIQHRLRRMMHGVYFQPRFKYAIYTRTDAAKRTEFAVEKPTTHYKGRFFHA